MLAAKPPKEGADERRSATALVHVGLDVAVAEPLNLESAGSILEPKT